MPRTIEIRSADPARVRVFGRRSAIRVVTGSFVRSDVRGRRGARREPLDVALRHGPVKTHEPYEGLALLRRHIEPHDRGRTAGSEVHEENVRALAKTITSAPNATR